MWSSTPVRLLLASSAVAGLLIVVAVTACSSSEDSPAANGPATDDAGRLLSADGAVAQTKTCNGVTVPTNDPKTGCATVSCEPCVAAENQNLGCNDGICQGLCVSGFSDCDEARPGCETKPEDDLAHCGGCAQACAAKDTNTQATACKASKCEYTCTSPFAHCASDNTTACETDLSTNLEHCGACGNACLDGGPCIDGGCQEPVIGDL